jgi:exodeoxyribonuclease VII large subunit
MLWQLLADFTPLSDLIRQRPVLKPSQLNTLARDMLEASFAQVWVEGELSNVSRPGSGHLYFTLKDDRAQIRCALFKQKAMYLRFQPRDGMQVLVRGRLTLYEARGDYQLLLEHMEEAGEGALQRAFTELKNRLNNEGVFDDARKRTLPTIVHRLAVITSASGAAVRDVISVITRRFPLMQVDILPVLVQGTEAAADIRKMLSKANASGNYDAILITRGGGSLEDLWAFNDEQLARDIAASNTLIISAIGHEIDFTLCDFAADIRAATPSAAAELLAPDKLELVARANDLQARLIQASRRHLQSHQQSADQLFLILKSLSPFLQIAQRKQRLQKTESVLSRNFSLLLQAKLMQCRQLGARLERMHPSQHLREKQQKLRYLSDAMHRASANHMQKKISSLRGLARSLEAVSPLSTLTRGYAIIKNKDNKVLSSVHNANVGDTLKTQLHDGYLLVQVKDIQLD